MCTCVLQRAIPGHVIFDLTDEPYDSLAFRDDFFYRSLLSLVRLVTEGDAKVMVPAVYIVDDPGEDDRPSLDDGLKPECPVSKAQCLRVQFWTMAYGTYAKLEVRRARS